MLRLLLSCDTPEENLALDEALLEQAEQSERPRETLRLWEPAAPLVVVGRSSHVSAEVNEAACRERGLPIFRRMSGGAAIITGPGCLMYAVVLSYELRPALRILERAHDFVTDTLRKAIEPLATGLLRQGTCDLTINDEKFSGNCLRCRRNHMLYHGTLLYDFPLALIEECLAMPKRQPDYREGRPHRTFVANLPIAREPLTEALVSAWQADELCEDWPRELTQKLAAEKYANREWNYRR
jgi:lipoate-protein ligase A